MEPSDLMSSGGEPSTSGPVPGELVVQNGRHAGTRRPLADPVTVLGRSSGCHVRLNVDGVCALHCALFPSPAGLVVRDLGSQTGTFVNDAPVSTAPLRHGDVLRVGPFQFLIHNPEPILPPGPLELDALRAQAAAVAAQQAALIEEERRLEERRTALEKREDQLAAHLDERRRTLEAQQDELRQARSQLQHERGLFEEDCRQRLEEIEKERKEAGVALRLAGDERRRLSALRRLLRRRWRKHWTARERALYRREQELATQQQQAACEEERLRQEKTALGQARLRHNGDVELGRRQLRDGWDELGRAHKEWGLQRQREESALARRAAEVDARSAELARLRRQLAEAQRQSQSARRTLEREAEGLETRVRNLRTKLAEHERSLARFEPGRHPVASAAPPPAVPLPVVDPGPLAGLDALAGEVADQRRHLLEQWEQFLQAQQEWHDERLALLAEADEARRRLDDREAGIALQEAELAGRMGEFEDRCIALSRQRLALEGQQARLLASEAQWQASRDGVLARAEAQAQDADARQATLEQFRARWLARRKAEVERLARELKRCRHLQREYEALRDEYHQRVAAIGAEQKALRDRQLALEQLQDELAGKSEDSAALERRLQRLASYWASQHVDVDRRQGEGSRELQSESGRLRGQSEHLHRWAEELQTQSSALTREQADRDQQRLTAEQQRQRVEHENWSLRQQSDVNARQLKAVQDELERVIRVLLDETADPPAALRAA